MKNKEKVFGVEEMCKKKSTNMEEGVKLQKRFPCFLTVTILLRKVWVPILRIKVRCLVTSSH